MTQSRSLAAIVGPGNIGTDLLTKLQRSERIDVGYMVGIDPDSDGLARAQQMGVTTSAQGVDWLLDQDTLPDIVFDSTSAAAHAASAPRFAQAGIQMVDLTPAAVGPFTCPVVNLPEYLDAPNLNLITCGGQATIPIVHAVSRVTSVPYAEIVASVSSRSAGPGTRANIDEFTETTSQGIEKVGGADRGKAIIIINPMDPPMIMRDTVFCAIDPDADRDAITDSIHRMVESVQEYVPGYRLTADPQFDDPRPEWDQWNRNDGSRGPGQGWARVAVFLEVAGNGDFLPTYAGNLDIMTAAAAQVGELLAERSLNEKAVHQ